LDKTKACLVFFLARRFIYGQMKGGHFGLQIVDPSLIDYEQDHEEELLAAVETRLGSHNCGCGIRYS